MAVLVSVFNANTLDVTAQVNNGTPFSIAGASPTNNFTPQLPASGGPTWSNVAPSQNVLGPGVNNLNITPKDTPVPFNFQVTLPKTMQWISVQLYIFWNTNSEVNWIVLNNGQYVTGSISLAAAMAQSQMASK